MYGQKVRYSDFEFTGVLGFPNPQALDEFRGDYRSGDFVLYIGTTKHPTPTRDRRRVLALVRLGRERVSTKKYTHPNLVRQIEEHNNGEINWPYGLRVTCAKKAKEKLDAKPILPRLYDGRHNWVMSSKPEPITAEEEAVILGLDWVAVDNIYAGQP